jgi:hypothetical protein
LKSRSSNRPPTKIKVKENLWRIKEKGLQLIKREVTEPELDTFLDNVASVNKKHPKH